MPRQYGTKKPARKTSTKTTSNDQVGRGAAKKATKQVEKRKRQNRSALEMAQKYTRR
jgi:hypothetical protein